MLQNFEIEQDFILSDLQYMREFDMSNFVANANTSLGRFTENATEMAVDLKFNSYISYIDRSLNVLNQTKLVSDPKVLSMKFANIDFDSINYTMKPLDNTQYIIRPKYLTQFVDNIGLTLQRLLKNGMVSDLDDELDHYVSSDIMVRVRRQMVSSSLPVDANLKDLADLSSDTEITVSNKYYNREILPFLDRYVKNIKEIVYTDADAVKTTIAKAQESLSTYIEVIIEYQKRLGDDVKTQLKLNKVVYNTYRCCLEATAFLAFSMIRKINVFVENTISINMLCNKIISDSPEMESAFDRGIVSSDSKAVGEALLRGDIDAFQELSNDIYEYNSSLIASSPFHGTNHLNGDKLFSSVDFETDQKDINDKAYKDTLEMIGVISQGLDVIAKNSDDYLLVFDDILEKSGFSMRLEDRFSGTLSSLDDIREYQSAVAFSDECRPDMNIYFKILKEVREYPERMGEIADQISECKTKMNILSERFSKNINQEFQNTVTIQELKNFFENLNEEFTNLVIKVGGKFMLRLKNMAIILEQMNKARSKDLDNNYMKLESEDLRRMTYLSLVEEAESTTDLIFESMLSAYLVEKKKQQTGIQYIIEAEDDQSGKGKKLVDGIKNKINTWFDKVINKIQQISDGVNAKRDQNYFAKHKNDLLNRNYTNVTTKTPIIEYEKLMPFANITSDIKSLVSKTSPANLSPQRLQSITDQESAARILFGNRPPIDVWKAEKISDAITKFYKSGNYPENPVELKNNDVKAMVEDAVNYCEPFYQSFLPQIRTNIERIKTNMETAIGNLVQESVIDSVFDSLFVEAPGDANQGGQTQTGTNTGGQTGGNTGTTPQQPQNNPPQNNQPTQTQNQPQNNNQSQQTQNVNTVSNMANKGEMIQKMVQQYCNAILTASFDRYKDYMQLLKSIIKDEEEQPNNNQTPEQNNNPPQ